MSGQFGKQLLKGHLCENGGKNDLELKDQIMPARLILAGTTDELNSPRTSSEGGPNDCTGTVVSVSVGFGCLFSPRKRFSSK